MSLPEAIVYLLASAGYGMKTDQIAREINERRLYVRRDGADDIENTGHVLATGRPLYPKV